MPMRMYPSELDCMSLEVLRHPRQETGGSLFGAFTHTGQPIIFAATGPGLHSRHAVARFWPDAEQMERGAQYANEDTQKRESELRASIADREALAQINTRQSMEM